MKKLLSFFSEKRLILGTLNIPSSAPQSPEKTEIKDLSTINLSENSGEKIQASTQLSDDISQITNNEIELVGKEISFQVPVENSETVRRSFVYREKSLFAKELKEAVQNRDDQKIKYLSYKYLRDLYLKNPKGRGLDNKKFGESNLVINDFIQNYESKARLEIQNATYETTETQNLSTIDESTLKMNELERTQEFQKISSELNEYSYKERMMRDVEAITNSANNINPEHNFYSPLSRYNKEEIRNNYENLFGNLGITNTLKSKNPKIDQAKASEIVADIIYARGADNFFTDKDIFDQLKKHKILNYKDNYRNFTKKILEKGSVPNDTQEYQDFAFVRELSDRLKTLRYDEKTNSDKKNLEGLNEEFSEEEKVIIENLEKLFNFSETKNSSWEKFVAFLTGTSNAKDITMSNIDGKTSYLDEGIFKRHTNTKSAINILITDPNFITIENGKPKILAHKILEKINSFIRLGEIAKLMQKTQNEEELNTLLSSNDFRKIEERNYIYSLSELQSFNNEQKELAQLGFILDRAKISQKEEKEAGEIAEEKLPEYWLSFEQSLQEKNVPKKVIEEIKSQLLTATGTSIVLKDGKFDRIEGFGIGGTIPLSEGFSLSLGVATDLSNVEAGAGISVNLYKGNDLTVGLNLGLSSGGNIGAMLQASTGNKDIELGGGIGIAINFANGKMILGGNAEITFKIEGNMQRNIENAKKESPYFEAFEKIKYAKTIDEKYNLLMQIPGIENTLRAFEREFSLTKEDIVNMVEMAEEQIIQMAIENTSTLDSALPLVHKVGVAMVGVIPVPYISFYIGTAEIFIPNRKSLNHLKQIRNLRQLGQDIKMEEALKTASESKEKIVFNQTIKEVTYTSDGEIAIIEDSRTINLNTVSTRLESFNEALKELRISLSQNKNGKTELNIFDTRSKDMEMYIDPALTDLALIKDGNKFAIEGNLENLVITREKLNLPFSYDKNSSNVREVIIIRSKNSLYGQRDRDFITSQTEGSFFSKKSNQGWIKSEIGTTREGAWIQNNLLDIPAYLSQEDLSQDREGLNDSESRAIEYAKQRSQRLEKMPEDQIALREENEKNSREVVNLLQKNEYEERYNLRDNLQGELEEKLNNKEFYEKLAKTINDTNGIINLLNESFPENPLNNKEITEAISIIQDLYFSQIIKEKYEKLSPREANQKIAQTLRTRRNFFKKELKRDFEETLRRMGEKNTEKLGEEYSEKVLLDTIDKLIFKLENDANFDYRNASLIGFEAGDSFYSVTRNEKGEPVSTYTLSKNESEIPYFTSTGIIEASISKYPNNSKIGKMLIEMLSPTIGIENEEFLKSGFTRKILALSPALNDLLTTSTEKGEDVYQSILKIAKDPSLLEKEEFYRQDFELFKNLVLKMREHQLSGKKFIHQVENGPRYEITFKTNISAGAFNKCGNSSFKMNEEIQIIAYDKDLKIVSAYLEHNEVVENQMGKVASTITGGVAIRNEKTPETPEGKEAGQGPGKRVNEGGEKQGNEGPSNTEINTGNPNEPTPVKVNIPREQGSSGSTN